MTALTFNAEIKIARQTLARIEKAVLDNTEDWRRAHLGASVIGRSCTAALWWSFRWASDPGHSGRMLRLFARGQREEDSICDLLRLADITVVQVDPHTGDQYRFSDGHFGGSMDGAVQGISESSKWSLLEIKTSGKKAFDQLEKAGVERSKPEHFAQMQCYMHWSGMTRALYVSVCKDDDRLHMERVAYDREVAERYVHRAQDIIASDVPMERISDDPTWYECKWCEHRPVCHGASAPLVSCRTCTHVTFNRDGTTHCALHDCFLSVEHQRVGCESHIYNPAMLRNWAEPVDASVDENWIRYRLTPVEGEIVNGQGNGHFRSSELAAAESPAILVEPAVLQLRERFDGRITA